MNDAVTGTALGSAEEQREFDAYERTWHAGGDLRSLKEKHGAFYRSVADGLAELVDRVAPAPEKLRVCEVGCGSGRNSFAIADRIGSLDLLDFSPAALDYAASLLPPPLAPVTTLHQGNALTLPYPDDAFDLVHSTGLVKHYRLDQAVAMMREQVRVTRPGGHVIMAYPNRWSPACLKARLLELAVLRRALAWVPGYRDPDDMHHTAAKLRAVLTAAAPGEPIQRHFFGSPLPTSSPDSLVRLVQRLAPGSAISFTVAYVVTLAGRPALRQAATGRPSRRRDP